MKRLFFILLLTMCGMGALLFIHKSRTNEYSKEFTEETKSQVIEKSDLYIYKSFREKELLLNGRMISPLSEICNSDNEMSSLESEIQEDKIVLYFSEFQCEMCVDSIISQLNEVFFFDNRKLLLWVKSSNIRYVKWIEKNYGIKRDVVYRTTPNIEEQLLDIELPYFFVLEKETMRINSTFIPLKENVELTKKYLTDITAKY